MMIRTFRNIHKNNVKVALACIAPSWYVKVMAARLIEVGFRSHYRRHLGRRVPIGHVLWGRLIRGDIVVL